jgi:tetratricopeptide (TPR) repeat protein
MRVAKAAGMTSPSFQQRWLLVVLAALLGGCITPVTEYGGEARYAPAYRSYVFSGDEKSDDPAASVYVLVNPITGDKLRCREDVHRWLGVYQDALTDKAHDANVEIAAGVMFGVATPALAAAPALLALLSVPGAIIMVGGLAAVEVGLFTELVGLSDDGFVHYEAARKLFEQKRWEEAAREYEVAILKEGWLASGELALYELGVAYAELGRADDAREALSTFVSRALVRDVKAYRNAERWLKWLDEPMPRCESQAPLKVRW